MKIIILDRDLDNISTSLEEETKEQDYDKGN